MANSDTPLHILIDTNVLFRSGNAFNNPDFRKLLLHSKNGAVKLYVSQITWEERRTQLLEEVKTNTSKLRSLHDKLNRQCSSHIVLEGLPEPSISIWEDDALDVNSKKALNDFASEHDITIIPYADDHAERAWERYFSASQPFNSGEERENRRKDIPDSWIFEAAIDLKEEHKELFAIGDDGRLSSALAEIGVVIFKDIEAVLQHLEQEADEGTRQEEPAMPGDEAQTREIVDDSLDALLKKQADDYVELEKVVLGFIGFIETPSKDELFELLQQSNRNIPREKAENIAERLVLAGLVKETSNRYIIENKQAGESASKFVEDEIASLINRDQNGI